MSERSPLADCGTTPACRADRTGLAGADGAQHWARLVAMPGWVPWSAAWLVPRQEVWLRGIGFMPVRRRFVSNRAYCSREFLMTPSPGRRRDFADHCL